MPLFSLILSIVFVYVWLGDVKYGRSMKEPFWKMDAVRFAAKVILLIPAIVFATNSLIPGVGILRHQVFLILFSMVLSAGISTVWYKYLRVLDVYEPERKRFLFLAFILSCFSVFLVFPISDAIHAWGFDFNGEIVNDFLYSVIGIGMVEEFVKLIPLLTILFFTKQIDEPLDYLVYAGMSALGFAFIENILYLESSSLSAISGRLLYASVAHMFFASCIAYPLGIYRAKTGKRFNFGLLLMGFLIAALAHGFYDFWLISEKLNIPILTTIFFLGSLQIFTLFNNNLINVSNFFNPTLTIKRRRLKYDLVWNILLVIYLGYFFFGLYHSAGAANKLLLGNAIFHVSVVVYIGLTFSSFNFIKGYRFPIRFPIKFFLPKADGAPDYTGSLLRIDIAPGTKRGPTSGRSATISGMMQKRVVLEGDPNWYFLEGDDLKKYLVRPRDFDRQFDAINFKRVIVLEINEHESLEKLVYTKKEVLKSFFGLAWLNKIG